MSFRKACHSWLPGSNQVGSCFLVVTGNRNVYFWWGAVAQWLGRATDAAWKLWQHFPFKLCQCLSEETLKAVGPYVVSMPGEVKYPTQGVNL